MECYAVAGDCVGTGLVFCHQKRFLSDRLRRRLRQNEDRGRHQSKRHVILFKPWSSAVVERPRDIVVFIIIIIINEYYLGAVKSQELLEHLTRLT